MANTVVGFTIEIDGVNSINELNQKIKETKESMNALDISTEAGKKEFNELSQTLGELVGQQKALKKAQDDVNKSFLPEKAVGAYDKLSAELNKLRKEFKNAALDGSKTTDELDKMQKEIQQLDKTLKNVDGQVGQFQRSVGNYPRTFQRVTRSLYTAIPGFEAFSDQLRDSEGRMTTFAKALIGGFLAFQAASAINRAIGQLDEFNKKILETRDIVMQMSGAYGDSLDEMSAQTAALAETFDTDAKTIAEAAKSISNEFGISFEEALQKVEGALVEGRGDANDYLQKIKEYPEAFKEAGNQMSETANQNKRLLDSNKELAKSQITVSKQTKEIVTSFKEFKNAITSQLINFLVAFYEALKPIGTAFYNLGSAVYEFINSIAGIFTSGNQAISVIDMFGAAISLVLSPIQFLIDLVTGIVQTLNKFYPVVAAAAVVIGTFAAAVNAAKIASAAAAAATWIYNGAIAAYTTVVNVAKLAQDAFNKAVRNNPIGLAVTGLIAAGGAIATYTQATKESTEASKDNTDAVEAEMDAIKQKAEEEQRLLGEKMKQQQKEFEDAQKKREEERKIEEDKKKAQEKYNQMLQKLTQEREKFAQNELNAQKNALAVLADLRAKYIDEQIKNIKDERVRQVKEIEISTQRQLEALDAQFKKLQESNKQRAATGEEQLKEAIRLYGKGSSQVQKIREENSKALEESAKSEKEVTAEIQRVKAEIIKKGNSDIEKLNSDFRKEDLEKAKQSAEDLRTFRDQILQEEQSYIDMVGEMRLLKNSELLERALAQETDAKKREELIRLAAEQEIVDKIAIIRNKLQSLNDAEAEMLDEQGNLRADISQEEYDKILLAKQQLNTELAGLERQQTEVVKKQAEDRLKANIDTFNQIAGFFKQGVEIISDIMKAANERQEAMFDAELERSQKRQEAYQAEIDNSTGLRRRFYEERLQEELANEAKIEEAKERLRKKAAKQQKATAIIQSIINTALAVTQALGSVPPPFNFIAASVAGAAGAIQTGIIAAQPLAKGGVVGKFDEVVQFANGGKVTSKGNIKPLSNGDNVLATLKTGEVVLNEEQQRRIGYKTLKAAKIPNFASGGVVGAPTAFVSDQIRAMNEEQKKMQLMEKMIQETQSRIDRIQVVYTASTEDDVDKARQERKEIKTTAEF